MRVTLSVDSDDQALNQLYWWLRDDDVVARSAEVSLGPAVQPGQMGSLDVVDVVLTNVTSLLSLVLAYASWRQSKAVPTSVTFMANGISITVHDASSDTIEYVLAALTPVAGSENTTREEAVRRGSA
jgi:hypothetical protein